jgi:hypothetical protein
VKLICSFPGSFAAASGLRNVDVEVDSDSQFLLIDLGTTGTIILIPGTTPVPLTLTGIIAVNLNLVQIIAPVTPL